MVTHWGFAGFFANKLVRTIIYNYKYYILNGMLVNLSVVKQVILFLYMAKKISFRDVLHFVYYDFLIEFYS